MALLTDPDFSRKDRVNIREQLENFNTQFNTQIDVSLFCTDKKKIETTFNKLDANYWIREEGVLLWKR